MGRHEAPAVRHAAFRLVCAALGAPPALVDDATVPAAAAEATTNNAGAYYLLFICQNHSKLSVHYIAYTEQGCGTKCSIFAMIRIMD